MSAAEQQSAGTKARILIIDDEPFIAKAVSKTLRADGYEVEACLEWLQVSKAVHRMQPHLILLDVNMPVLTGDKVCAILRAHMKGTLEESKIVFYSSEPVEDLKRLVTECGADGYIPKNTPSDRLLARIAALISLGKSLSRSLAVNRWGKAATT